MPGSDPAYRTISEVADLIGVPQHVLRFWETKFAQIQPLKRGGNRRYYRSADIELLTRINRLLHTDGYTIKGVQKLLEGVAAPVAIAPIGTGPVAASSIGAGALQAIRTRLAVALAEARAL